MSDHVDQLDNVTMYEARVYVGWDAPKFAGQMTDAEVLAKLDESYPGGTASFAAERAEAEEQYEAGR